MKFRVLIQPPARADIEAAYLYLRERSEDAAQRWLSGLEFTIARLSELPERFGLAPESKDFPGADPSTRVWTPTRSIQDPVRRSREKSARAARSTRSPAAASS